MLCSMVLMSSPLGVISGPGRGTSCPCRGLLNLVSSYEAAGITIGALAEQTGLTVATLRAWASRYGLPTPRRSASGHRRYSPGDAEQVREVLRLRTTGLSLEAAVARARDLTAGPARPRSIFAALRRA